jgi:3-hydroxyisobutyrate dehydrogenase-like beta-hydroxyacid dehydrogenase
MNSKHIGFLHPGAMGVSLAATAQNTGHTAYWASDGRSRDTYERAAKNSLVDIQTIEELCDRCSVIISVCPPHAAREVAEQVLACSFKGIYADVNAISPHRTKSIGQLMSDAGVEFVDGGIIGGPAWKPDSTWLYLSGRMADQVAACFAAGPLATEIIGDEIGQASALKMCFAANTKGTTALLCAIVAAAEELGVREELERQWSRHGSQFARNTLERVRGVTPKAWRFSGEMEEIASTFEAAGLPGGFHLAASDIYQRLAKFKGTDPTPAVEDVLAALLDPEER